MLKLLVFAVIVYGAMLLFLYLNQRQLIYFPSHLSRTPIEAGVPEMQVVKLKTKDHLDLAAWYHPPLHSQMPVIIYFHGNGGDISLRSPIVKPYLQEGYGVLLVTYRGYSGNPGEPSEEGLYKDARAAIGFLLNQNMTCVVLYGESLGTAVALQMAAEYDVAALVLQSPFISLAAVGQFHYPFFPVKWLIKDKFNNLAKVKQIRAPTLILYAEKDMIVPPRFSLELYELLPGDKYIEKLPNIGHNNLFPSSYSINFIKTHVNCEQKKIVRHLIVE